MSIQVITLEMMSVDVAYCGPKKRMPAPSMNLCNTVTCV